MGPRRKEDEENRRRSPLPPQKREKKLNQPTTKQRCHLLLLPLSRLALFPPPLPLTSFSPR